MDKIFIKKLIGLIKDAYPKSKGKSNSHPDGFTLMVRPFKHSKLEFLIAFDEDPCIIQEDFGFDPDAKGSNTSKVYFPQSKDKFNSPEGVFEFLKSCIVRYIKYQQDFYNEGKSTHLEFTSSEDEAIELASSIYEKGFLKELGIKL